MTVVARKTRNRNLSRISAACLQSSVMSVRRPADSILATIHRHRRQSREQIEISASTVRSQSQDGTFRLRIGAGLEDLVSALTVWHRLTHHRVYRLHRGHDDSQLAQYLLAQCRSSADLLRVRHTHTHRQTTLPCSITAL